MRWQIGEHLSEVLGGLPFQTRRLGLWLFLVFARASAPARRRRGFGGIGLLVAHLFLGRLSASIAVESRAITPTMRPPSERSTKAACILSGRSPCANSAKARGNVAFDGICERRFQPRIRRSDLLTSRRSISALVVGTSSIAVATKALASVRRSSGERPGTLGSSGTKASKPIASRVVTSRPSASVIESTSSQSHGNRDPGRGSSALSWRREDRWSCLSLQIRAARIKAIPR
jgi:hypothetical protein